MKIHLPFKSKIVGDSRIYYNQHDRNVNLPVNAKKMIETYMLDFEDNHISGTSHSWNSVHGNVPGDVPIIITPGLNGTVYASKYDARYNHASYGQKNLVLNAKTLTVEFYLDLSQFEFSMSGGSGYHSQTKILKTIRTSGNVADLYLYCNNGGGGVGTPYLGVGEAAEDVALGYAVYKIKYQIYLSRSGSADGYIRVYVDDALEYEETDIAGVADIISGIQMGSQDAETFETIGGAIVMDEISITSESQGWA